jgi:hypothetical protein
MSSLCDKYEACYGDKQCENYVNCSLSEVEQDDVHFDVPEGHREVLLRQIDEMIGSQSCGGNSPCWSPECIWEISPQLVRVLEIIRAQLNG